jgi:hypothetical protein
MLGIFFSIAPPTLLRSSGQVYFFLSHLLGVHFFLDVQVLFCLHSLQKSSTFWRFPRELEKNMPKYATLKQRKPKDSSVIEMGELNLKYSKPPARRFFSLFSYQGRI